MRECHLVGNYENVVTDRNTAKVIEQDKGVYVCVCGGVCGGIIMPARAGWDQNEYKWS